MKTFYGPWKLYHYIKKVCCLPYYTEYPVFTWVFKCSVRTIVTWKITFNYNDYSKSSVDLCINKYISKKESTFESFYNQTLCSSFNWKKNTSTHLTWWIWEYFSITIKLNILFCYKIPLRKSLPVSWMLVIVTCHSPVVHRRSDQEVCINICIYKYFGL